MIPPAMGGPMSQSTICPYCNTRLRLSSTANRRNRVKCRNCSRGFHPSQVLENDGPSQYLNQPLQSTTATQPAPERSESAEAVAPEPDGRPPPMTEAVHRDFSPETINPRLAEAAYPSELLERRAKRKQSSERVRERTDRQHHRTGARELALVVGLLTAGVGGAAYLGWYLFRPARTGAPTADSLPSPPIPNDTGRPNSLLESDFAAKPLPKRLIGQWELRNDDERRGWFDLRSDGTMTAYAWVGDQAAQPTRENWFLNQETGDDFVIEIGQQIGVIGNSKYHLTMTGNDAFTLTLIAQMSSRVRENQRFVRRTSSTLTNP
jgi:hypothetical protein